MSGLGKVVLLGSAHSIVHCSHFLHVFYAVFGFLGGLYFAQVNKHSFLLVIQSKQWILKCCKKRQNFWKISEAWLTTFVNFHIKCPTCANCISVLTTWNVLNFAEFTYNRSLRVTEPTTEFNLILQEVFFPSFLDTRIRSVSQMYFP